jgi:hypothetical protein
MAKFLLLIRGGDDSSPSSSPEDYQKVVEKYIAWSKKLREEGRNLGGEELGEDGAVVRKRDGQVVIDGPFAETKEAIGGYFMIEATDLKEAAEIAKGCPAVGRGGCVDVRPILEHG